MAKLTPSRRRSCAEREPILVPRGSAIPVVQSFTTGGARLTWALTQPYQPSCRNP